jgi:hypothetical protein
LEFDDSGVKEFLLLLVGSWVVGNILMKHEAAIG